MTKKPFLITLTALLCGISLQAQQAWTQKKGEGYFQTGASFFSYATVYNTDFEGADIPRPISEVILSFYGEYGITDKLTGTLILPLHLTSNGDLDPDWAGFIPEEGSLNALGNINLALTYQLYQKGGFVLSSKLATSLNTSDYAAATGLRTGYDAFGISPTLLAGIGTAKFFASAETGMNFLTNGYANRYVFSAQIGKEFTRSKRITGIFSVSTSIALGDLSDEDNAALDGNSVFTALYQNEQTYYAGSLKLGYKLSDNWALWGSVAGGVAKNIGQNAIYALSIGYNLKKASPKTN